MQRSAGSTICSVVANFVLLFPYRSSTEGEETDRRNLMMRPPTAPLFCILLPFPFLTGCWKGFHHYLIILFFSFLSPLLDVTRKLTSFFFCFGSTTVRLSLDDHVKVHPCLFLLLLFVLLSFV